jgi:hypothetical protein
VFLANLSSDDLAEKAEAALESGDWSEARDLLDRLCVRGVRGADLPSLEATPNGAMFAQRRPAYAELLRDRIREVNAAGRGGL